MKLKRVNFAKLAAMGMMGIAFGYSAQASLITHTVGDASFDATAVPGSGYAYFKGPPDTAWLAEPAGNGNYWYHSTYDAGDRPLPRTGDQALHGFSAYNWQLLGDVFEADRTYTFSIWTQGDRDTVDQADTIWLYLYDGTATPQPADGDNLTYVGFNQDGTLIGNSQDAGPFSGFNRGEGSDWTQVSISHSVTAGSPEVGQPIGIGLYGRADAAMDDVTLTSDLIPEPHVLSLLAIGGSLVFMVRRRR